MDDDNGKSVKEMSIIVLDLNTRTWSSLKNFTITRDKAGVCLRRRRVGLGRGRAGSCTGVTQRR